MDTVFTASFIQQMHKDWLGNLYDWAGKYRTVDMSKDEVVFLPAYRVAENMELLSRDYLARLTPCKAMPVTDVTRAMAEVHATLVFIHPFREGHGRLARWLATLMAVQAGYPPPLYLGETSVEYTRKKYYEAMRKGYLGHYEALVRFFEQSIKLGLGDSESG